MTRVVFRTYPNGDVIALFPTVVFRNGEVLSYMHVGQHGECDYKCVIGQTKLSTEEEYEDLKNELENSIGYKDVKVLKKSKIILDTM